ncbi:mRNA-decapping enzyme 1B-like [Diadema antillarum]|uniref:mRNA-decapping enzyme 1B-like n=1 Tax=Diadema antillarum TaxID=105358 RepID=UPI003A846DA1
MATNVDKAEAQMNLTALQQFDPYISDILLKASQVALYLFDHSANKWAKTEIQGTMFVYKRSATPYHGFMIMNRLSLHNLTEPITKELEYTLQEPFLLYKTTKAICGIWFYNREDCVKFAQLVNRLLDVAKQEKKPLAEPVPVPTGGGAVDIMQMLNKAQHEYKQEVKRKPSGSEAGPAPISPGGDGGGGGDRVIRPIPVKGTLSPGHVAKTDDNLPSKTGAKPKTSPMGPRFQRSVSMQETRSTTSIAQAGPSGQGEGMQVIPVLQRLMSQGSDERSQPVVRELGQVHTVESLEKLHTTAVESGPTGGKKMEVQSLESIERLQLVGGGAEGRPTAAAAGTAGAPSSAESSQHLQRLLLRLQSGPDAGVPVAPPAGDVTTDGGTIDPPKGVPQQPGASAVPEKQSSAPQVDMNQALLEKLKSSTTPAVNLMKPSATTLTPSILASQPAPDAKEPTRIPSAMKQLFPGPKDSRKTPSPPTTIPGVPTSLLTPEVLRARSSTEPGGAATTLLSPLKLSGTSQGIQGQASGQKTDPLSQRRPMTVLTKEELAQTLIYLLQNDDDFVTKIHSAYAKSAQRLPP